MIRGWVIWMMLADCGVDSRDQILSLFLLLRISSSGRVVFDLNARHCQSILGRLLSSLQAVDNLSCCLMFLGGIERYAGALQVRQCLLRNSA